MSGHPLDGGPRQYQCFDADEEEWSRAHDMATYRAWYPDSAAEQYAEMVYNDGAEAESFPMTVIVRNTVTGEETRHVVDLEWEASFSSSPE